MKKKISLNGKWNMFLKSAGPRRYEANAYHAPDYRCYVGRKERQYPDPFYATNREKTAYLSQNQIKLL